MKWYMGDQEIHTGHTQEDTRPSLLTDENNIISRIKARTWASISRLMLPVSKSDNGATVRCVAHHPALEKPLEQKTFLTIHCKYFLENNSNILKLKLKITAQSIYFPIQILQKCLFIFQIHHQ